MSQISLKSISGITSITTPAGVDNRFSLYNFDSTERFVLDHSGNLNISGVTTATNFKSGSSNLHSTGLNVGATFVHSTGINLGVGATVLNNGNAIFSGIITATQFKGDGDFVELDVDGHTNLDNVSIAGVTTFSEDTKFIGATSGRDLQWDKSDNSLEFLDYTSAYFGTDNNLQIYHNAGNNNSYISENGVGALLIQASDLYLNNSAGQNYVICATGGRVQLNFAGNNKLETTNTGVNITGICTATSFSGSGANLTNLPSSPPPNNFLINGAMLVNVRGTNHQTANSFNPVTSAIYTLDRWKVLNSNSFDTNSAKVLQDGGHPAQGFHRSIMMNIGNSDTPGSTQVCGFQQKIEAQNLQSLCYGQSTAKTMTLSFWVYSNKTGTYCVQIMQDDVNKYVLYEYTISSSNTWEKKTITITGNTADAINNDNGIGLEVNWILCVGSGRQASATSSWTSGGYYVATSNQVNLWDHPDNYFKMTGCQLQTGSTATDFVHEDIGTTLRKCQRYFYMACGPDGGGYETIGTGMIYYSGTGYASCYFPVTMRTQPSLVALSGSSGAYVYQTLLSNTAAYTHQISIDSSKTSLNSASVSCACPSSRNGEAFRLSAHFSHDANGGQSFVNFDAEL